VQRATGAAMSHVLTVELLRSAKVNGCTIRYGLTSRDNIWLMFHSSWNLSGASTRKAIEDDFLKLLVARAVHRVMVFQQKNADAVQAMFAHLTRGVEHFAHTRPGDRYLMLAFDWTSESGFSSHLLAA
jgi:hypothetical protein